MDQKELRDIENHCIQEEAPRCTAACPLHVDVRQMVQSVAAGDWEGALKTLRRTMPLLGVLGRICDHPCQTHCLRGQAGDPIEIGLIERALVMRSASRPKVMPLPSRGKRVAVVGSGLAGLTLAWDLVRKGYAITIFEAGPRLGGTLLELPEEVLPREVLNAEIDVLSGLGVRIKCNSEVKTDSFLTGLLAEYDAVYLGLEGRSFEASILPIDDRGRVRLDENFQVPGLEKVFAGGPGPELVESPSWVWSAAEGRWAATSIDRSLQKVSLTAGREKEGPFETRLFTSLEGVQPLPGLHPAGLEGYTGEEARLEARRCLDCQCLECVKVCPYLEKFGAYPKKYAREIYNNEAIVMGTRQANKLINSCSLCGLCTVVCPEDFEMAALCLEARKSMVRRGKMPPSAHEFALEQMRFSNSPRFALARHQPGTDGSAFVFFPGCQLSATSPAQVRLTYDYLRERLSGGVGLILGCCQAPAYWGGQEELQAAGLAELRDAWARLERPKIVAVCSTCYLMFKTWLPEAELVSLWSIFEKEGLPGGIGQLPQLGPLALHDPCTTRHEPELQDSVRRIIESLGQKFEELPLGREKTECCGFGGLMSCANPPIAAEVARGRSLESPADYLTYCAMCRESLSSAGKRVFHLLDLIFPAVHKVSRPLGRRLGWTERMENQAGLRAAFLKELWSEEQPEPEEPSRIVLHFPPAVRELIEARRILHQDIQKVILYAETSGDRFCHQGRGHYLASYKPVKATFWVEYSLQDDGFVVHNAYFHRMEISGGGRS